MLHRPFPRLIADWVHPTWRLQCASSMSSRVASWDWSPAVVGHVGRAVPGPWALPICGGPP